jgi:hypothetical protein
MYGDRPPLKQPIAFLTVIGTKDAGKMSPSVYV